ncbi:MAG: DNA repair and recombination protein RadA [Candidatus Woesearchaeota archaeon]
MNKAKTDKGMDEDKTMDDKMENSNEEGAEKEKIDIQVDEDVMKKAGLEDLPGVGAATAQKLKDAGYTDLMGLAVSSPGEIIEVTGISEAVARKMIKAARDNLNMGFESGDNLLRRREKVIKIKTGSEAFNELVGGGFETSSITECFGEFGSGKTQLAHILAVNAQIQEEGAVAFYIDTENTFRPERIKELADKEGLDPEKTLANIRVARAYNSDHQMLLAEKIEEMVKNENIKARVVVVDSLTAHFRAEFIGRGTLSERQQKLNKHMHTLLKLADNHNICVYVTNQVMSKPDIFFGDPTQAIGGHIVAHASTFRIYLRKGKKGSRVAKLIDSPSLPDGEASFFVETGGLKDIKA